MNRRTTIAPIFVEWFSTVSISLIVAELKFFSTLVNALLQKSVTRRATTVFEGLRYSSGTLLKWPREPSRWSRI